MTPVTTERLSSVDRAWLRMETDASPMTILGVIGLDGFLSVDEVRDIVGTRLLRHARFGMRLGRGRWGRHRLEVQDVLDLDHHVRALPAVGSEQELADLLGDLAGGLLGDGQAPWEVFVVQDHRGSTLIVPRLHHSLADGISLIQVLVSLADDPPPHRPPRPATDRPGALVRAWRIVSESVRLVLLRPDRPSSLRAPLTGVKRAAWSVSYDLAVLRDTARRHGVTVNDLVLGALSGAIGSVLAAAGDGEVRSVRAMVPFNLRPPDAAQPLGNRFGLVLPELPIESDRALRLRSISEGMAGLKSRAQGAASFALLTVMGVTARSVEAALVRFFATKSSLVMTNVPGPAESLHLGGRRIDRLMFWVPQAGGLGLGVSVLSYAGTVVVGILADTGTLPDPGGLVTAFEAELAAFGVPVG